jgi:cation transporter-like permease
MIYESVELSELHMRDRLEDIAYVKRRKNKLSEYLDTDILRQSITPLALSLVGLLMTSALLDRAQHWDIFVKTTELFLMVPVLLNLKGNLEMSVTGRLATASHKHTVGEWWAKSVKINGLILAGQSSVCSAIMGVLACAIGSLVIHRQLLSIQETLLILAVPMAATLTSAALNYIFMVMIISFGVKMGINPDNVATPIATAFGDFFSVAFLCFSALLLNGRPYLCIVCMLGCLIILSISVYCTLEDQEASELLLTGWIPIVFGLLITSIAGLVLERFYLKLPNLPIVLPVINGIAGGLVSIYVCRLTSAFETKSELSASVPLTLLLLNVPIQVLFALGMHFFKMGHSPIGIIPFVSQLAASCLQIGTLLYITKPIVNACQQYNVDTATYSLPIITATSDLLGTLLVIVALTFTSQAISFI